MGRKASDSDVDIASPRNICVPLQAMPCGILTIALARRLMRSMLKARLRSTALRRNIERIKSAGADKTLTLVLN